MAKIISRRKLASQAARRIADGEAKDDILREIAAYLIDSGRKHEASLIARDIETALIQNGIVIGTVVSARALSSDAKQSIDSFVKDHYDNVKAVVLRERVDTSVIGGVRIELPDRQLDVTVAYKLDKLTV
jgi:F0F1-type ATP synthase delta subunit